MSVVITAEMRAAFDADGVVQVPGAVGGVWVDRILEDAQRELEAPGPWVTDTNPGATQDRLFTTRYRWQNAPAIRDFVFSSPIAAMAASLTGSKRMRFYFDHLLVKEPLTSASTPWHQDIPYWPFLGKQIVSAWVSATSTRVSHGSLEFVRGSHRWNTYYAPTSFDGQGGWTEDFQGEPMPDIEAVRNRSDCPYEIVGFDVEPGDAIFFSAWIIHGSPANAGRERRVALSTRWLGDDATWYPHPGCDPTVTQDDTTAVSGEYPADDERFPLVYGSAAL
ncbi:MAG: phytanoyl-CoA dioxygenase family protein [Acidimicrobiaceae bacterium]|nr:phytanoyl-CoA dioxygenase family protein [Acidimicrobiaceae bacterium]